MLGDVGRWAPIGMQVSQAFAKRFWPRLGKYRQQGQYRCAERKSGQWQRLPRRKLGIQSTEITVYRASCTRSVAMPVIAAVHMLRVRVHGGYQRDADHRNDDTQRNRTQQPSGYLNVTPHKTCSKVALIN